MINIIPVYEIINEKTGNRHSGTDLEYFLDDKTDIGEVYLDGNLIFQSTSIHNEEELDHNFKKEFSITKEESTDA